MMGEAMKKKYILMAGYGAAFAGFILYMFTRDTAGLIVGGFFLCVTSGCKLLMDRR